MNTQDIFKNATEELRKKYETDPRYRNNIDKIIGDAIIYAMAENRYDLFTRTNGARQNMIQMGQEGMIYSLLYNMIQVSAYRHQYINGTVGKSDAFVTMVIDKCKKGKIEELEQLIQIGASECINRENNQGIDTKDYNQAAYEFTKGVLSCYTWFNNSRNPISSFGPITNPIDISALQNLENYYQSQFKSNNRSH